jgi:hypothetical protein
MSNLQSNRSRREALTAEAVREIGTLLVAFTPLDAVFAPAPSGALGTVLLFVLFGLLLFLIGLRMEETP